MTPVMPIRKPSAAVRTSYPVTFTGPKYLDIKIHVDAEHRRVIFGCRSEERLDEYGTREIRVVADCDCVLHFKNEDFFGISSKKLSANIPAWLTGPKVESAATELTVTAGISDSEEMYTDVRTPIIIRVP